ncbi:unnamed protein product [marine sediment metagenome]|uniref:Uncharacterized protein n=1 Tax=marine sediment metagenome TaxID=412755 RepID=X1L3D6_9ZZZZ
MVETKTLTVPLTEVPVGVANMRFAAYAPPLELREILAKKTEYEEGEIVYVKYRVKNIGDGAGIATIEIKDVDTGKVLQTHTTPSIEGGGYMWRTLDAGLRVGAMPDRDWSLSFKVTP